MGDFLLIIPLAAIFILIYFVMKSVDRNLDANDKNANGSPVLRKGRNESFFNKRPSS